MGTSFGASSNEPGYEVDNSLSSLFGFDHKWGDVRTVSGKCSINCLEFNDLQYINRWPGHAPFIPELFV